MKVESGGNSEARGASGEIGALQFLPSTWNKWSSEVLGYVPKMTLTNELYVAAKMIDKWLAQGITENGIAQMWNTGRPGPCIKGINKYGVAYDSCAYAKAVLAKLP